LALNVHDPEDSFPLFNFKVQFHVVSAKLEFIETMDARSNSEAIPSFLVEKFEFPIRFVLGSYS
jgi:hypothetical protein